MNLKYIWTMPGMSFRERIERNNEWWLITLAALTPRRIRYYVTLMELGKATIESPDIPATLLSDILQKLDKR